MNKSFTNHRILIFTTLAFGFLLGLLSLAPVTAQTARGKATVEYRLTAVEKRLRYVEGKLAARGNPQPQRWQKIRDNGSFVYMLDNETGKVRMINTMNGVAKTLD
jgi:hypothetical protein